MDLRLTVRTTVARCFARFLRPEQAMLILNVSAAGRPDSTRHL